MSTKRTQIPISSRLAAEIDSLVGKRGRNRFLTQAAEKELVRVRQLQALKAATGAWKDKDHPELKRGAAHWVKLVRKDLDTREHKLPR